MIFGSRDNVHDHHLLTSRIRHYILHVSAILAPLLDSCDHSLPSNFRLFFKARTSVPASGKKKKNMKNIT